MKILVTFAVDAEFAPWRRMRGFQASEATSYRQFSAKQDGCDIFVLLTGMGAGSANKAIRAALDSMKGAEPDVLICSGLAGGLNPGYGRGQILAPASVRDGTSGELFVPHSDLVKTAISLGAVAAGRLVTEDHLIVDAAEKRILAEQADAVDMETAALMAESERRGIPAVVVRSVSDNAVTSLPYDFSRTLDARGEVRIAGVLSEVVRKPAGFPALIRMARDCREAARGLGSFLDAYVAELARHGKLQEMESPVAAT